MEQDLTLVYLQKLNSKYIFVRRKQIFLRPTKSRKACGVVRIGRSHKNIDNLVALILFPVFNSLNWKQPFFSRHD